MKRPEQQLQRACVHYLKCLPVTFTHIPNGGARSKTEGAIFKGLGVRAGFPDLWIGQKGKSLFVELKADKRQPSKDQRDMHHELDCRGFAVAVCRSIDELQAALRREGFI